jgi:ribosomal protein L40E
MEPGRSKKVNRPTKAFEEGERDMFCTNCGAENKEEAKFCVKCGETFGQTRKDEEKIISIDTKAIKTQLFDKKTGFFGALFDFSFTDFVTAKIIKFLYGLSIFLIGLTTIILVIFSFAGGPIAGIFTLLIGGPLIFILGIIYTRVLLEIIMVIFKIAENTAITAKNTNRSNQE